MNVSLMDSYNLAWKLAYHLLSLGPDNASSSDKTPSLSLLDTYATERKAVAHALIDFDQRFSSMFSGKIGSGEHDGSGEAMTHEKFLEVFSSGSGFTSGCGIEYEASIAVQKEASDHSNGTSTAAEVPWIRAGWPAARAEALLQGALYPGRRLPPLRVIRHADSVPHELHEAFPSTGRFRILILCATDLLEKSSASAEGITAFGGLIDAARQPQLLEMVVLHPLINIRGIDWRRFPPALKKHAEMRTFCAAEGAAPEGKVDGKSSIQGAQAEGGYGVLCVRKEKGAWAVVRPDGVVGVIGAFEEFAKAEAYLSAIMAFL